MQGQGNNGLGGREVEIKWDQFQVEAQCLTGLMTLVVWLTSNKLKLTDIPTWGVGFIQCNVFSQNEKGNRHFKQLGQTRLSRQSTSWLHGMPKIGNWNPPGVIF